MELVGACPDLLWEPAACIPLLYPLASGQVAGNFFVNKSAEIKEESRHHAHFIVRMSYVYV